jgi:hypothetical protein
MQKHISFAACLLVLALLAPSHAGLKATSSQNTFKVVDANGKSIGQVIGVMQGNGITIAAFPYRGKSLPVVVLRSTFQQGPLEFTSNDCTGQPYEDASTSPFPVTSVNGSNTLFAEAGPVQSITVKSILSPGSPCSSFSFTDSVAVPVAAVADLNEFTPPFSVVSE